MFNFSRPSYQPNGHSPINPLDAPAESKRTSKSTRGKEPSTLNESHENDFNLYGFQPNNLQFTKKKKYRLPKSTPTDTTKRPQNQTGLTGSLTSNTKTFNKNQPLPTDNQAQVLDHKTQNLKFYGKPQIQKNSHDQRNKPNNFHKNLRYGSNHKSNDINDDDNDDNDGNNDYNCLSINYRPNSHKFAPSDSSDDLSSSVSFSSTSFEFDSPDTSAIEWECATCTFLNYQHAVECRMCGTLRIQEQFERNLNLQNDKKKIKKKSEKWICIICTNPNDPLLESCETCGSDKISIKQQENKQPRKEKEKQVLCHKCEREINSEGKKDHTIKNQTENFDSLCIICMENPRNTVLTHGNTGHLVCCFECATNAKLSKSCPVCRMTVTGLFRVYYN